MSEQDEMIAAWEKQTGEHWHEGKGITRELWAAAWQAARRTVSGQEATWSNIYDDLIRAGMDDIRARALAAKYAAPIPAKEKTR